MRLNRILYLIATLLWIISCDYRTASKTRFERTTNIELSDSITVIEDIFQESGPDYGLSYKVSLTKNECLTLIDEVQKSPDWEQEGSEFEFYKTIDGIIYNITFSSKECIITYYEDML